MHKAPDERNMSMSDQRLPMQHTAIDLRVIAASYRDEDGVTVMTVMMNFEEALSSALDRFKAEMSGARRPSELLSMVGDLMPLAIPLGATDLVEVTRRADGNLRREIDAGVAKAGPDTARDIMVWSSIVDKTRTAISVLFHACLIFKRAPNGKDIPT
jgi:hypothetical protein